MDELLLVVPTNRKLRKLKKEIITKSPNQATTKINIETLSTLSTQILRQSLSFVHLSEAASTVMIAQSAAETDLTYFTNYGESIPSGTLDKLKSVFSEYKKRGVQPATLTKEISSLKEGEQKKNKDIANIYSIYLQKCNALSAYEIGDIYSKLLNTDDNLFVQNFRLLFPDVKTISISGFDEFTLPEINLLDRIASIEDVLLFINFDYDSTNLNLFSHLDECFGRLLFKGFREQKSSFNEIETEFKREIKHNLFSKKKTLPLKPNGDAVIIEAATREKEIELIAKEIKNLIIEKEVAPGKIAVVFNLIEHYSFLVRDIFTNYAIPFNLSDRLVLNNSSPVVALINFLEILENDFYYKNLMRSLHSGFIKIEGIDVTNLSAISKELKIVVGENNWQYRLKEAIKNAKRSKSDFPNSKIEKLQLAQNNISAISHLLAPFSKSITIAEFKNEFLHLIEKLKINERVLINSLDKEEESIKSLSVLIETLDEIFSLLEQEKGADSKYNLKFYLEQIRTAVGWARYNVKEKSNYGVQVTTLDELRGLNFDYLFISGMNDGEFPTRYSPEIFYSKAFMIKKEKSYLLEQRYRFYQALCSWEQGLYLTFAKTDNRKELVKSSFLKDLLNLFLFDVKTEKDYEYGIYNNEEVLKEFGEAFSKNNDRKLKSLNKILQSRSAKYEKAIVTENMRTNFPFRQSIYNGILTSDDFPEREKNYQLSNEAKNNLEQYGGREYSISQLETFAKCPFKYFAERVLKLNLIEEPTEEIEAIEMGSVLHSILFEFYTSMREQNFTVADDFSKAIKIIFAIAKQKIEDAGFSSPISFFEKEKIFGLNGDRKKSILYKFLEEERENNSNKPAFFEVSFGRFVNDENDELLSTENPLKIDNVLLRGKIDRVDLNETDNAVSIIDYKLSGKKIPVNDLHRGLQLQLPVYLFAMQKLLMQYVGKQYEPLGMEIYSLKYSQNEFGKKTINLIRRKHTVEETIEENKKLVNDVLSFIKEYVGAIAAGEFNLSIHEDREKLVCKYCDLKKVCRVKNIL